MRPFNYQPLAIENNEPRGKIEFFLSVKFGFNASSCIKYDLCNVIQDIYQKTTNF